VVDHARNFIIFETGMISEAGDWDWKRALQDQYIDDEAHIGALARAMGPRLRDIQTIGWHSIHGIRRPLLLFKLNPPQPQQDASPSGCDWVEIDRFRRTFGSQNQTLIKADDCGESDRTYLGTMFLHLEQADGQQAFAKHALGHRYKMEREFAIATQIDHPRAVKPIELNPSYGLVYPYLRGQSLSSTSLNQVSGLNELANGLFDFLVYAEQQSIELGDLEYSRFKQADRKLIDLIDVHPGNVLAEIEEGAIKDWKVIDFEYYSNSNAFRNWKHLLLLCRSIEQCDRQLRNRIWHKLLAAFIRSKVGGWHERLRGDWPDASGSHSYEVTERFPLYNMLRERTRLAWATLQQSR
ncbi:MAG: hypothetical protein ACR2NZ_19040, partial [Rubripirellula sp.]